MCVGRDVPTGFVAHRELPPMQDREGIEFLQWCLPKLRMRWPGFRKVRKQVYKRIARRMKELALSDPSEYRAYLETHGKEWTVLDRLCWVSISRFYRDKGVFHYLENTVLPELAARLFEQDQPDLRCWSIGCAAGEEPYTLALLWNFAVSGRFPSVALSILATDPDPQALARAEKACYSASSLKDLPQEWQAMAFVRSPEGFCLREEHREQVTFRLQDIRLEIPPERFHVILCRYLAFTYFDEALQQETLATIKERLLPGGALVIGSLESLPCPAAGFETWSEKARVYRRSPC